MEGKVSLQEEGALSWQVCSTARASCSVTALQQQLGTGDCWCVGCSMRTHMIVQLIQKAYLWVTSLLAKQQTQPVYHHLAVTDHAGVLCLQI
jgi:hypothetical protein